MWVASKAASVTTKAISELSLSQLAKEYMTDSPRFSKVYSKFLSELTAIDSASKVVVVQTAISGSFTRSIRRHIKALQAELLMSSSAN
jgi:hypothetical protein